ncbi:hypothetical protein BDV96DRAFT_644762 [Lophiotrema nucula]|uniref:Rhodopsin domain-containing protein n=1 Tax=Lophiotrema nucula TaxID=690887 RepID=A0A6A5ZF29_9PLEO|nr:hypothetical protein BDV96DRAFT_644762 [Lophiotrema nucula]
MAKVTIESLKAVATPPPVQLSDLEHHPNELWRFNIVAQTVCTCVAGLLFCLRCYVRLGFSRLPKHWILEDWFVLLSFTGLITYSALMGLIMSNYGGVHIWNLTTDQEARVYYYFWWETILYGPFVFCTKLSILLMYLRLLIPTRWSFLWTTVHIFIWISACFYVSITLVKIFQCSPMRKAWAKHIHGHCIDVAILLCVSGMFNTISDLFILLIPVKACWNLQMSLKKKIGVCAVFTIGAIAPIFSGIGFAARWTASQNSDLTYNNPRMLLWATAEITTGVICSCLPTLPALVRRRRLSTTTAASRSYNMSSNPSYPPKPHSSYRKYMELDELTTAARSREMVTTVTAGANCNNRSNETESTNERWNAKDSQDEIFPASSRSGPTTHNGIVKTVRIEQTDGSL